MNSDDNTYRTELVKRACKGDMTAFYEIVELYKKKVYFTAYRICGDHPEAEDISQEVFIKVFRFLHKFRLDAKLSTWIYQVTVNTAIDAVRKQKKKQVYMENTQMETMSQEATVTGSPAAGPEKQAEQNSLRRWIRQALPDLSRKEQTVFALRYYNEMKLSEIAEIMNISVNTIKTMLLRAKKKLRKRLAAYHPEYDMSHDAEVSYERL